MSCASRIGAVAVANVKFRVSGGRLPILDTISAAFQGGTLKPWYVWRVRIMVIILGCRPRDRSLILLRAATWPRYQVAKISAFHAEFVGSIPAGATIN